MWKERKEFVVMREKILTFIEKNSRIDLKELAIILGVDEASVVNELQKMEEEQEFQRELIFMPMNQEFYMLSGRNVHLRKYI